MQDEFDQTFYELPADIQKITAEYLPTSDLEQLKAPVGVSQEQHFRIFKPVLDVRILHVFLDAVVQSDYDRVQIILEKHIDLIVKKGVVTDNSGRAFKQISPFEYALWALDMRMWTMMLECIPQENKIFATLLFQYDNINTHGATYNLNGEEITEKHFDFDNTIIKELKIQVGFANAPGKKDWDVINRQWQEDVGGAQKLLPTHVIVEAEWLKPEVGLRIGQATFDEWIMQLQLELCTITKLSQIRKGDFVNLKPLLLEKQMIADNQSQVLQI